MEILPIHVSLKKLPSLEWLCLEKSKISLQKIKDVLYINGLDMLNLKIKSIHMNNCDINEEDLSEMLRLIIVEQEKRKGMNVSLFGDYTVNKKLLENVRKNEHIDFNILKLPFSIKRRVSTPLRFRRNERVHKPKKKIKIILNL